MSSVNGVPVGFRTRQALQDLRSVVALSSAETLDRIVAGTKADSAEKKIYRVINADDCILSPELAQDLHSALLLAATLPDDDFEAFTAATAILLADRLGRGAGPDDLYWHWDAFQEHYRILPQPSRAAILNAFAQAHADGLVALYDPPSGADLLLHDPQIIARALADLRDRNELPDLLRPREAGASLPEILLAALDTPQKALDAAVLWPSVAAQLGELPAEAQTALTRAFRHLYHAFSDWDPYPGQVFPVSGGADDLYLLPLK